MTRRKTTPSDAGREYAARLLALLERDVRARAALRVEGGEPLLRGAQAEVRAFDRFAPQVMAALDRGDVEAAVAATLNVLASWARWQQRGHAAQLSEAQRIVDRADRRAGAEQRKRNTRERDAERREHFERLRAESPDAPAAVLHRRVAEHELRQEAEREGRELSELPALAVRQRSEAVRKSIARAGTI